MTIPHKAHSPGFLALVQDAKSRVEEVDIAAYQKMPREDHLLIDVREAGHGMYMRIIQVSLLVCTLFLQSPNSVL